MFEDPPAPAARDEFGRGDTCEVPARRLQQHNRVQSCNANKVHEYIRTESDLHPKVWKQQNDYQLDEESQSQTIKNLLVCFKFQFALK